MAQCALLTVGRTKAFNLYNKVFIGTLKVVIDIKTYFKRDQSFVSNYSDRFYNCAIVSLGFVQHIAAKVNVI